VSAADEHSDWWSSNHELHKLLLPISCTATSTHVQGVGRRRPRQVAEHLHGLALLPLGKKLFLEQLKIWSGCTPKPFRCKPSALLRSFRADSRERVCLIVLLGASRTGLGSSLGEE
jgi:hypothetical protein